MTFLTGFLLFLATVALMEGVAYVAHRWVMHGFLWSLHASHHRERHGIFEANDWFAVMFATPSILCFVAGMYEGFASPFTWIGLGIAAYGAIYFGFHDVIVHRRLPHRWRPTSPYIRRIVQAHRLHHAVGSKEGTVSFGFLVAPPVRALKAQLAANEAATLRPASATVRQRYVE